MLGDLATFIILASRCTGALALAPLVSPTTFLFASHQPPEPILAGFPL